MRRVIVESPYAGDVARNVAYARLACQWLLRQGVAPFASHLIYTQCLDDRDAPDRKLGMRAGMAWREGAHETCVFVDFGISRGMEAGIAHARKHGHEVREVRLRDELGEADFADALVAMTATVHQPTVDFPTEKPPKVDPRQMTIEEMAANRVLHCEVCSKPIRTIGGAYRCSASCRLDNRKMYGESVTERVLADEPHEPQIGGA